ncbi:MAG: MipA/OmpV family protein [Hyphomicrobiaceae bacterium]|nr:MipA/OmpV family protein [Hyphomicrobiaceae bacterium]
MIDTLGALDLLKNGIRPQSVAALMATVVIAGMTAVVGTANAGGEWGEPSEGGREIQAGGLVIVKPKYEGSSEYEVIGVPLVAPGSGTGDGKVSFKGIDDLRFRLLDASGFEAGPLVGYRFGREDDDARRLLGLGDVDGGLIVGGYAGYRFGALMPFVSYHYQVTGDETGGIARLGVEAKMPLRPGLLVTATAGTTWADEDYMQSYFGITPLQSATSVALLAPFDADAGFKDVFLGLSASVPVADRWSLKLTGRYTHLIGDAADSPIVESESQFMGGLGLTYRFDIGR